MFQLCYKMEKPVDKNLRGAYANHINSAKRENLPRRLQLCYKIAETIAIFFRL